MQYHLKLIETAYFNVETKPIRKIYIFINIDVTTVSKSSLYSLINH